MALPRNVGLILGTAAGSGLIALVVWFADALPPILRFLPATFSLLLIPLGLLLVFIGLVRWTTGGSLRVAGFMIALFAVIQLIPAIGWSRQREAGIERAKTYCERLASAIEAEHETTRRWPESADRFVATLGERPSTLRVDPEYRVTEDGFELSFVVPGAMFSHMYTYSSATGEWVRLD